MNKIRLKNGLTAYRTTALELVLIGGFGICDECNSRPPEGYLVPVLNHWMCPKCFDEWKDTGKYNPQDAPIEARNCRYYESKIPITNNETEEI